jgi:hypothetical protein
MPLFKRSKPAPRAAGGGASGGSNGRNSDKLMDWSMKDHEFKVQLFRFVDAFPVLRTPDAVHEHLVDYLTQPGVKLPPGMDLGLKAGGVAKGLMTRTDRQARSGHGGEVHRGHRRGRARCPGSKKLWESGIAFSVDLLGEACVSDAEADDVPRQVPRPRHQPARDGRGLARERAARAGPPRRDPAHERVDQAQLALGAMDPIDPGGGDRRPRWRAAARSSRPPAKGAC